LVIVWYMLKIETITAPHKGQKFNDLPKS